MTARLAAGVIISLAVLGLACAGEQEYIDSQSLPSVPSSTADKPTATVDPGITPWSRSGPVVVGTYATDAR